MVCLFCSRRHPQPCYYDKPLCRRISDMRPSALAEKHPWTLPWWRADGENFWTMIYIVAIHILAVLGLVLFPLPGWKIFFSALALAALGGFGTTIGFHRGLAHRAVKLNPVVEQFLIFCAVFNGSGSPDTWIANHRNHHAKADTIEDVSSPRHGGFWWAHLRWLYQWEPSSMKKWCPDLIRPRYTIWILLLGPVLLFSLGIGLHWGWEGFFWIGAIRLVYTLHFQMVVNSLLHMSPEVVAGKDSSRNIWWVGPFQLGAWGE